MPKLRPSDKTRQTDNDKRRLFYTGHITMGTRSDVNLPPHTCATPSAQSPACWAGECTCGPLAENSPDNLRSQRDITLPPRLHCKKSGAHLGVRPPAPLTRVSKSARPVAVPLWRRASCGCTLRRPHASNIEPQDPKVVLTAPGLFPDAKSGGTHGAPRRQFVHRYFEARWGSPNHRPYNVAPRGPR